MRTCLVPPWTSPRLPPSRRSAADPTRRARGTRRCVSSGGRNTITSARAGVHQFRREPQVTENREDAVIALSAERGLSFWSWWALIQRGWALAQQEREAEEIAQIREGLPPLHLLTAYPLSDTTQKNPAPQRPLSAIRPLL